MKRGWWGRLVAVAVISGGSATGLVAPGTVAQRPATRLAAQAVDSSDLRAMSGLAPDSALLFNGWGLTPAGRHVTTTDLPLKLVLSPDGKTLAAVHGGYNEEGLTLIDVERGSVSQFLPLKSAWNGVAFSADGHTIW